MKEIHFEEQALTSLWETVTKFLERKMRDSVQWINPWDKGRTITFKTVSDKNVFRKQVEKCLLAFKFKNHPTITNALIAEKRRNFWVKNTPLLDYEDGFSVIKKNAFKDINVDILDKPHLTISL